MVTADDRGRLSSEVSGFDFETYPCLLGTEHFQNVLCAFFPFIPRALKASCSELLKEDITGEVSQRAGGSSQRIQTHWHECVKVSLEGLAADKNETELYGYFALTLN